MFRHTYRAHLDQTVRRSECNRSSCSTATCKANATTKAKREADSKVVQMVIARKLPEAAAA